MSTFTRYFLFAAALSLCLSAPSYADPAAPTPAAPASPGSSAGTDANAKPGLLSSKELLIEHGQGTFRGTTSVIAAGADRRSVKFSIDVTYTGNAGLSTDGFAVFYPGITFRFVGSSCIPAKGTQFTARNQVSIKPAPGAGMGLSNGRLVSTGPMIVSGSVSIAMTQGAAVVEFTASSSDPLIFKLTKNGYRYISGTGTVKLPSGNVYEFRGPLTKPKS